MNIPKALQHLCTASMALWLVACATDITLGHLKEDEALEHIHTGSTMDDVQKNLGSPSSKSSFGPMTWYYVSSIHQKRSVLPTKVLDQHVVEIAFDQSSAVTGIKQYTLADGKNIEVATDTTPTEGQKLGFFEQVLSNLGRFNNNTSATSNSHTHGDTVPGTGYPR